MKALRNVQFIKIIIIKRRKCGYQFTTGSNLFHLKRISTYNFLPVDGAKERIKFISERLSTILKKKKISACESFFIICINSQY